jgi:signal transduction histidine kinase
VASVLLGLALAHLISQRYVHQPLRKLESTAERLRAGDFSARAPVGDLDNSEFGRLADTFNRLSTQLQKWHAENDVAQEALRVARDEALRASQSKTSFVASVGHDLRQPLHAMAITASLLKLKLKNMPEAVIAERMGRSVSNLSDLVHALLDVSQLDAGLIEPEVSDFTVDSLLQSSTEDFVDQATAKGVRLVVEPSAESVRSDPRLLRRMVQNIVSNAVKYTPAGGTVTARAVAHDDAVEIVVSDTGPGIPAAQQQAVWEEFRQLANPERDHRKGLGLGMSIVKRMADLLGHEVSLSSASGKGTSVTVRVPRRKS